MRKNAIRVSPRSVSEEAILAAAKKFLQSLSGDDVLVPIDNPESFELGASDLTFVKKGKHGMVAAMLHRRGEFEGFVLKAAAYYGRLKAQYSL